MNRCGSQAEDHKNGHESASSPMVWKIFQYQDKGATAQQDRGGIKLGSHLQRGPTSKHVPSETTSDRRGHTQDHRRCRDAEMEIPHLLRDHDSNRPASNGRDEAQHGGAKKIDVALSFRIASTAVTANATVAAMVITSVKAVQSIPGSRTVR